MLDNGDGFLGIIVIIFLLVIYFAPTAVANHQEHPQTVPIFVLNLFLGWTLVFWVIALTWAFSKPRREAPTTIVQAPQTVTDELERLAALRASGAITDDEFTDLKAKALAP